MQQQDPLFPFGHYPDLAHKTILVTGASSGIGRAVAIALGNQGCHVILSGRNKERLEETASQINAQTSVYPCDLSIPDQRNALADAMPKLDGVCHSAGIINPFPIRFLNDEQFDRVFDINAKAPILLTSRLLGKKKLNDKAAIVFISSIASDRAMKGGSVYSASKAAIEAFSRCVTLEHTDKKIRANCLKPGLTETNIFDQTNALSIATGAENWLEEYKSRYPLGLGKPDDIAAATLFLLSAASRWVTGATLTLDGGLSKNI